MLPKIPRPKEAWKSVEERGRAWKSVEERGRAWKSVEERGRAWKSVEERGRAWKSVEERGRAWKSVEERGRAWKSVEAWKRGSRSMMQDAADTSPGPSDSRAQQLAALAARQNAFNKFILSTWGLQHVSKHSASSLLAANSRIQRDSASSSKVLRDLTTEISKYGTSSDYP